MLATVAIAITDLRLLKFTCSPPHEPIELIMFGVDTQPEPNMPGCNTTVTSSVQHTMHKHSICIEKLLGMIQYS